MYMNDSEILGKFNRADDKKQIVQVLADLNGCSKSEMEKYLVELGIPEDSLAKKKRGRKPKDLKVEDAGEGAAEDPAETKSEDMEAPVGRGVFEEMPSLTTEENARLDRAMAIPTPVRNALILRADYLTSKIQELMEERSSLYDYLEGKLPT